MEIYKEEPRNNNENLDIESPEQKNLEAFMIAALGKYAHKINEGSRGIILRIDLTKFSDENLAKLGIVINRDRGSVFKILKIENASRAHHEYEMQKRAVQILNTEESQNKGLAQVPNIIRCIDIDLSHNSSIINKLHRGGVDVTKNHSTINVIMMDYVPGITLSQYIFKKIIQKIIEKDEDNNTVKNEIMRWGGDSSAFLSGATFKNFCEFLEKYFNIYLGSGNSHIIKKNEKLFLSYMEKNEVVLNEEIFDVFRKSVLKLNNNNIYNNDLHEDNVILDLDDDENLRNLFLIDFGEASDYRNDENPDDLSIFSAYINFTTTKEQKNKEKLINSTKRFENSLNRFRAGNNLSVDRVVYIQRLINLDLKNQDIKSMVSRINQELISDNEDYVIIAFMTMLKENKIGREKVLDILEEGQHIAGPTIKWKFVKSILLTKELI